LTQALNELKEEKEKEENLKEKVEKQIQTDNEGISEVNLQSLENKNLDQTSTLLSSGLIFKLKRKSILVD